MSVTPPAAVPRLEATVSGDWIVECLRSAVSGCDSVVDWAQTGAVPLGWSGDAATVATHAMTTTTREFSIVRGALSSVLPALTSYVDEIADLRRRRESLVEDRDALEARRLDLEAMDTSVVDTAVYVTAGEDTLNRDIEAFEADVTTWSNDVAASEDRAITALQAQDTLSEAAAAAPVITGGPRSMLDALVRAGDLSPELRGKSPEEIRRWLLDHPGEAAILTEQVPDPFAPGTEGDFARVLERAENLEDLDGQAVVREYFETLPEDDARLLALLFPAAFGNLAGAPFTARADANAVRIAGNLHEWGDAMGDPVRELYEDIVANDRQIILFDPEGDGAMVEMFGTPGTDTENAGIYVPGTGSNLENFENVAEKAKDLQDKASVTFAWLGGDFPDGAEAGSAAHAVALAPGLASFTHQVRQELTHAESPASAEITLEGHSYGGAVVGYTENHSPDAQTVLHIESAGMGHDIFTPEDLPASQEDVVRYSMTAPDDWIAPIQGAQEHSSAMTSAGTAITASNPATIGLVFPWNDVASTLGHGADPDEFEGMIRLHTGNFSDDQPPVPGRPEIQPGAPIIGTPAHSNVFQVGSDAQSNMFDVVNRNTGSLQYYREPIWGTDGGRLVPRGYDPTETVVGWGPEQEPE